MDYDGISYSHDFLVLGSRRWREQQTGFPPAGEDDGLGRQCESQSVTFFEMPKVTEKNRQRNSELIQLPGPYYYWPGNPVKKLSSVSRYHFGGEAASFVSGFAGLLMSSRVARQQAACAATLDPRLPARMTGWGAMVNRAE